MYGYDLLWIFDCDTTTWFQMKFLAMHITNQTFSFYIFKVGHLQNIFMEHDLYLIS